MKLWPTNQDDKKTGYIIMAFIALFIGALGTRCAQAEESYAQVALGSTVVRGEAPVISVQLVYPDAGPRDAQVEIGASFIGESTFNGVHQQNNFALTTAVVDGFGPFEIGLGTAYLQNTDIYNGSHVNFKLILGYKFKKFHVRLEHFSNGGTVAPNKGRDMLLIYREL